MNTEKHRPGVSEVNLVVRHLKLENATPQKVLSASEEIEQIYGLDAISFDQKTQVINLAYDASQIMIDGIEYVLKQHGMEISHDWWTRFKEGYYRFVDQNVKDNAKAVSHCCNKPPIGAKSKK
jgi:hypothetical protein